MKLTFPKKANYVGTFKTKTFFGKSKGVSYFLQKISESGNGEMIEDITKLWLTSKNKKRFKFSRPGEFYDFELKDIKNFYVDVRRVGHNKSKGKSSYSLFFGYTSGKGKKYPWQEKAKRLKNGGYLIVNPSIDKFEYYYIPAKLALKQFRDLKTGKVSLSEINERLNLSIKFKGVTVK
jgi:hypothetical protein